MKEYHILFTGVGRRVELLQEFRQAALSLGICLKIYGADMCNTAPALVCCDYRYVLCGMKEASYIPQLIKLCEDEEIDLLIPTIDTDLMILSENVEMFRQVGTRVLISSKDKIAICRDKNLTATFFESCGLRAPRTVSDYENYQDGYPCFIKPKNGSSSVNAFKVKNYDELKVYASEINDYIVQPFIAGKEYTLDIFCDFEGSLLSIVPRERLAIRSGEVLKTRIVMDKQMIEEGRQLVKKFEPCGPLTVQLIRQEETEEDYFIEINPRFGGGAPLGMKAGGKSVEALLELLTGKDIEKWSESIHNGAIYSRFDQSVCVEVGNIQGLLRGVIFDLDDTLYSEKQYVRSGFRAIAEHLEKEDVEEKLWEYFLKGKNAIDELVHDIGQKVRREELLKVYREHMPKLDLYDGVIRLIADLKNLGIKVGIVTDGRPIGQKNKIKALGLDILVEDIIITDELGGEQFRKPNDIAFRIMQCRWGCRFEQMLYVGDNLEKDFQAPTQLGIRCLYFENEDGLYYKKDCCDTYIVKKKDWVQYLVEYIRVLHRR